MVHEANGNGPLSGSQQIIQGCCICSLRCGLHGLGEAAAECAKYYRLHLFRSRTFSNFLRSCIDMTALTCSNSSATREVCPASAVTRL